jgi:mitofilin
LELQASNAKQLWLAVQSLSEILGTKAADLNSASELIEVVPNIDKIRESAPENQFIQTIVSSLNVKGGVWSEPDLKERFQKLKTVCNRVALIDERGGSLFKYFISYLQSYFIIHAKIDKHKLDSVAHEALNLNELNLDTFNILDYSEYYMESGNIELAIRLMQQLRGEPARLAKDWIKEAIRLLEIRQACNLLNAYISSIYVGTNFK